MVGPRRLRVSIVCPSCVHEVSNKVHSGSKVGSWGFHGGSMVGPWEIRVNRHRNKNTVNTAHRRLQASSDAGVSELQILFYPLRLSSRSACRLERGCPTAHVDRRTHTNVSSRGVVPLVGVILRVNNIFDIDRENETAN